MKKKTYKQPTLKSALLDTTYMLAGSTDPEPDIISFGLHDTEPEPQQTPSPMSHDLWGIQW